MQSFLTFDSLDRTLKCDHSLKVVEQYFTVVLFVNPLTPRVKPWVIQSFLTFHSMDRTLKCDHSLKDVEQYLTVVLFVFQFYPVCNFGKFISFGLGTVRSERLKRQAQTSKRMMTSNRLGKRCKGLLKITWVKEYLLDCTCAVICDNGLCFRRGWPLSLTSTRAKKII